MADLDYTVAVNTSAAERNLANLQKSVGGMNDTFLRFKSTLATISLGAIISQSLQFADAIGDLSDATGVAIPNIMGFTNAVMANGGSAETAQKAILKLVNSIGEAADGSASAQQAFRDVGVSIGDLRTLSEQDILSKTIAGLDKITDSGKRSTLVTQLLGKEFRNVAVGQLADAYKAATAESAKYADSIRAGAAAQQNIDKTLMDFKTGLLEAIKPFTELISKVNIGVDNFQKFVQALLAVGAALLALSFLGKIVRVFVLLWEAGGALIGVIRNLSVFLGELANGWRALYAATEGIGGVFARVALTIKAVAVYILELLTPAFGILKAAAMPVLAGVAGYWGWIQDSTSAAIDKLREYASILSFGLIEPPGVKGGRGNGQAEVEQRKKDAEEALKKAKDLRDVLDRQAEATSKAALGTKHYVDNLAIGLSRQVEAIAFETNMINLSKLKNVLSEDQVEIYKAQNESQIQGLSKIKDLEQQREKLSLQLKFSKDEEKAGINAQIGQLGIQITKTKEYYSLQDDRLADYITKLQTARMLDAARIQDQQNMIKAIEDQIARQQQLGDTLKSINDQKVDIKFQGSQQGMGPLEKQISDIQENARKAALEAGRAFAATFPEDLSAANASELADGLDKIAKKYASISAEQIKNLDTSRSWSTGWKEAFNTYKENAYNTAAQAKGYFDTFSKGFEDTFVNMVKTGDYSFAALKNGFKDVANSMIADFIRIQAQRALLAMMPGGSVFSGIASLFGMANGGPVQSNVPIMVGERGPELFIPKGAGSIVPNGAMNAAASSGQAMQTIVNYHIQAVDSSSFRSLVARDPSFIYAVTEQGRRSQPTRRLG